MPAQVKALSQPGVADTAEVGAEMVRAHADQPDHVRLFV